MPIAIINKNKQKQKVRVRQSNNQIVNVVIRELKGRKRVPRKRRVNPPRIPPPAPLPPPRPLIVFRDRPNLQLPDNILTPARAVGIQTPSREVDNNVLIAAVNRSVNNTVEAAVQRLNLYNESRRTPNLVSDPIFNRQDIPLAEVMTIDPDAEAEQAGLQQEQTPAPMPKQDTEKGPIGERDPRNRQPVDDINPLPVKSPPKKRPPQTYLGEKKTIPQLDALLLERGIPTGRLSKSAAQKIMLLIEDDDNRFKSSLD